MSAKYIMEVLELMIIILLFLVLFILMSQQPQPMPAPAPAPAQKHKKSTSGCKDTGYGCCPYSEIPKLNEIGSNCRYQN